MAGRIIVYSPVAKGMWAMVQYPMEIGIPTAASDSPAMTSVRSRPPLSDPSVANSSMLTLSGEASCGTRPGRFNGSEPDTDSAMPIHEHSAIGVN